MVRRRGRLREMAHQRRDVADDATLAHRYARLRSVIETLAEGVVIVDGDGHVVELNAAAEGMLALDRAAPDRRWQTLPWRWFDAAGEPLASDADPFAVVRRNGEGVRGAEFVVERADGLRMILSVNAAPLADDAGAFDGMAVSFADVTERKLLEAQLRHQAFTDELTGLANRLHVINRLQVALEEAHPAYAVAVLYLDLDGFKAVNDAHGHEVGDRLLSALGLRLRTLIRPGDVVGRLGGDEFMVVVFGVAEAAAAVEVGERLRAGMRAPFAVAGHTLQIGVSVGVAVSGPARREAVALLRAADEALYRAKHSGRDRVVLAADAPPVPS